MANEPVDFNNPESLEAALAATTDVAPDATTKGKKKNSTKAADGTEAPKERKPKVIKVSFVADRDILQGETVEFDYTLPLSAGGHRGALSGKALDEMTDDELKIEYRNANSVAYKTKKNGKDTTKADERLNAVKAAMEKRGIQPTARTAAPASAADVAKLIKEGKISIEELEGLLNS